jgi:hypothetical protein|nr:MAG TPA: Exonuclease [Caudoviricetes sp.]
MIMFDEFLAPQPQRCRDIEERIDLAVAADPAAWRRAQAGWLERCTDWRDEVNRERKHLGASAIGKECPRGVALSYRGASPNAAANGRMVRLFNRGHMEEARLAACLQVAGFQIKLISKDGGQISYKTGDLKGSVDGVIRLDDGSLAVLEFKTMNRKAWDKLEKGGQIKPEHLTQMQCGMHGLGLKKALYLASCKDTDAIQVYVVEYSGEPVESLNLATDITHGLIPPKLVDTDYRCKFCDHKAFCHGGADPVASCRTCVHASFGGNGVVTCGIGTGDSLCHNYAPIK